jgi:hydroxyacylglutathione hydrolase
MIGLDTVAGAFDTGIVKDWLTSGRRAGQVPQLSAKAVARMLDAGEIYVLDVRGKTEWEAGHIHDSPNIPIGYLTDRLADIPRDKPLVVYCQAGARSAIAASVLQARGVANVINMTGGYEAWSRLDALPRSAGKSALPARHLGFEAAAHNVA